MVSLSLRSRQPKEILFDHGNRGSTFTFFLLLRFLFWDPAWCSQKFHNTLLLQINTLMSLVPDISSTRSVQLHWTEWLLYHDMTTVCNEAVVHQAESRTPIKFERLLSLTVQADTEAILIFVLNPAVHFYGHSKEFLFDYFSKLAHQFRFFWNLEMHLVTLRYHFYHIRTLVRWTTNLHTGKLDCSE